MILIDYYMQHDLSLKCSAWKGFINFWSEKNFGSEKNVGSEKKFDLKKNLGTEKILGPKKF